MLVATPDRLTITRLERARLARFALAGALVLGWVGMGLLDAFMAAMFFADADPTVWLVFSPALLAAAWVVHMANARGVVEVRPDALVIRHRRVLRRPLVVPRTAVERILLDDGSATGMARFATGDVQEPLLWTRPLVLRQPRGRAVIGDSVLPNVAIVLRTPIPLDAARGWLTAVPFTKQIDPPPRTATAEVVFLAMDDLQAVEQALAAWPVERPEMERVIPQEVPRAAARVPQDAAAIMLIALAATVAMAAGLDVLVPVVFAGMFLFIWRMNRRRQAAAASARAEVARRERLLPPADRAAALAAIEVNLSPGETPGPPRVS